MRPAWRRFVALLAAGLVPWVVVLFPFRTDLLFSWGWINLVDPVPGGWHVVRLDAYLFEHTPGPRSLPRHLQAWPIATALYASAVGSALGGVLLGREDDRVTAGLALLAAVSILHLTVGLVHPDATPIPIGAVLLGLVVWWYDADSLRSALSLGADEK